MPLTGDAKRVYQREWRAARRAQWFAGRRCVDCGATGDLELDHRDPAAKVAHAIWSWSWERLEAEAAKCDVRCGPCHRERHAAERRGHGISAYENRGCRCDVCVAANDAKIARRPKRSGRGSNSQGGVSAAHALSRGAASPVAAAP